MFDLLPSIACKRGIHLKSKHSRFNGETYGIAVDSAIPTVYKPRAQEVDGTHCIGKDHCEYGSFGGCVMIVGSDSSGDDDGDGSTDDGGAGGGGGGGGHSLKYNVESLYEK
ncbi:LOW QUALITY PROTEIN: hypothetical protein V1477_004818 [Vespula maculifrons]|uniref:Uncharacterized protein n=1 Tax=Vespula maculifrons TaxID=7453 RepID=A0ABD2CQL8_VESMC